MLVNNPGITKTNPMRRNSTSSFGAIHPILFFMLVYGISLLLAIFVCRTVYNSLNGDTGSSQSMQTDYAATSATALR
jgi:hypothetical protein